MSALAGRGSAGGRDAGVAAKGGNEAPDAMVVSDSGTPAAGGSVGIDAGRAGNGSPDSGAPAAGSGGTSGSGAGGTSGAAGADAGSGGPELGTLRAPSCPSAPANPGGTFCYDFEQGHKGPEDGQTYWLWDTPELPAETELTTREQPGNHVLFASPRLTDMYPSATIGHDTQRFSRALVEFDFWANGNLLAVDEEVVIFRYVPDERDFSRVTNLILLRGEAYLQLEDGSSNNVPLARAPAADDKTHVSIVLDRSSTCSVQIYFDGQRVVATDPVMCAPDGEVGFVEYGLVMLERSPESIDALYDNIALGLE
jgi:hypothetical protein